MAEKFVKPSDARMRRPEALEKGKDYDILQLCREKSKFPDKKTGKDVYKSLAIFKDFGMKFFVFMSYPFDNKPDSYYEDINKQIADGKKIRFVYYGKLTSSNEMEILMDDEVVNQEKLQGIRKIEEMENDNVSNPYKKFKSDN